MTVAFLCVAAEAEEAAVRTALRVASWASAHSLASMLNELNGAQPGDAHHLPLAASSHGSRSAPAPKAKARPRHVYGGGGFGGWDDYDEPVRAPKSASGAASGISYEQVKKVRDASDLNAFSSLSSPLTDSMVCFSE